MKIFAAMVLIASTNALAVVTDQIRCTYEFKGSNIATSFSNSLTVSVAREAEPVPAGWEAGTWMTRGKFNVGTVTGLKEGFERVAYYRHASRVVDGKVVSKINFCSDVELV